MEPQAIYEEALKAAHAAAAQSEAQLPPESQRGFDCGFAWVRVHPARGNFITWCKKNGKGKSLSSYGMSGYEFYYSEFDPTKTQSIDTHFAAARAFAGVLTEHGINAHADKRLD